jgi:tryptophan 2,3-dioxygenase
MAKPISYPDYLQLDRILGAQAPESAKHGTPAHDEMLFIIIHQTYELWFKQILHELDRVQSILSGDVVDDADTGKIVHALIRLLEIKRVLIHQIDILETMTPMDFLEFRDLLIPASGFQSAQFRLVETRLGLKRDDRLPFDDKDFDARLAEKEQKAVRAWEGEKSLIEQVDAWLARTPFVAMGGYEFQKVYTRALNRMLDGEEEIIRGQSHLGEKEKQVQLDGITRSRAMLDAIFDAGAYAQLQKRGEWRLSQKALQAALFINLYRDEPALQGPYRMLSLLMDIDEAMSTWRYRHALMALRMIGRKVGTGGSSGHDYLRQTTEKHRIFTDLFAIATFLIPRSRLPALPDEVRDAMRYRYAGLA